MSLGTAWGSLMEPPGASRQPPLRTPCGGLGSRAETELTSDSQNVRVARPQREFLGNCGPSSPEDRSELCNAE